MLPHREPLSTKAFLQGLAMIATLAVIAPLTMQYLITDCTKVHRESQVQQETQVQMIANANARTAMAIMRGCKKMQAQMLRKGDTCAGMVTQMYKLGLEK